jgi:hypothetical protein
MLKIEELENSSFIVVAEGVENFAKNFINFQKQDYFQKR